MKKLVIIGLILLLTGGVLFAAGFAMSGWDITSVNMKHGHVNINFGGKTELSKSEYTYPADDLSSILIKESHNDVIITKSPDNLIHVVCYEAPDAKYDIKNGAELVIIAPDAKITFGIAVTDDNASTMTLQLPEGVSPDLEVQAASSEVIIRMPDTTFQSIEIETASGEIEISGIIVENGLDVTTVSGEVKLSDITAGYIYAASTSGDVNISGTEANLSFDVTTVSGDLELSNITSGYASLSTTSGEIEFKGLDVAETIMINSVSGEIIGSLPGGIDDYLIYTSTTSGENDLPTEYEHGGTRTLMIESVSGDINIRFHK